MRQFYTYLHCKPDGTPFYVGKGTAGRAWSFCRRNRQHVSTVAKYGRANIRVYVFHCDSEAQAFADEVQQIAQLRAEGCELANRTDGGEGTTGHKPSAETLAKRVAALKGKTRTPEQRKLLSELAKGRIITAEQRAKISAAKKGKSMPPRSDEYRAKITARQLGRPMSMESRARIAETLRKKWQDPIIRASWLAQRESKT